MMWHPIEDVIKYHKLNRKVALYVVDEEKIKEKFSIIENEINTSNIIAFVGRVRDLTEKIYGENFTS